jgi:pyrophosphatase PpaX
VTRFHSAYEETGELVSAFPGIHEGLSRLRDGGIRIAVVTSKARRRFVLDARRADLEDLIDVSVCAEDAAAPKPDPAPLLLALEALAAASQDALVVGDTEVDMIAGTRAGIPAAGVAWGASSEGELRAAGARIVAGAPGELVAYVLGGSERQV